MHNDATAMGNVYIQKLVEVGHEISYVICGQRKNAISRKYSEPRDVTISVYRLP